MENQRVRVGFPIHETGLRGVFILKALFLEIEYMKRTAYFSCWNEY